MPKKTFSKRGRKNPAKEIPPHKTKPSLAKQVRLLKAGAVSTRDLAGRAGKKLRSLHKAADSVHVRSDVVHSGIGKLHLQIKETEKKSAGQTAGKLKAFIIAGVGASAGGFEAFAQLLENLSPETGMALVRVQHLDPTHESKLAELLPRATPMRVTEITNETSAEPNHVYVIPPNRALTISQGVLRLQPRRRMNGPNLPIDQFFESLARDHGNRAVGVILSGNGLDGTHGLKQIKAEGGITFGQDEKSAKFYGMPGNALHAGCVDFVLPPAAKPPAKPFLNWATANGTFPR